MIHVSNNTFASLLLAATFTTLDPSRDVLTGAVIGYGTLALVLTLATRGRLGYGGPYEDQPEEGAGKEPGGVPAGHVVAGTRVDLPGVREA